MTIDLREADVQCLPFSDASFENAIASCVFCSVPDPVLGLCELRRVLVPGGRVAIMGVLAARSTSGRRLQHLLSTGGVRFFEPPVRPIAQRTGALA